MEASSDAFAFDGSGVSGVSRLEIGGVEKDESRATTRTDERAETNVSSLGFDETLSPYDASSDGVTSACVASGAAARAGLAPALAGLVAALNVAAREESARHRSSTNVSAVSDEDTKDPTASTPSGRARDGAVWALSRLVAAPGRAGALARRSIFSASVAESVQSLRSTAAFPAGSRPDMSSFCIAAPAGIGIEIEKQLGTQAKDGTVEVVTRQFHPASEPGAAGGQCLQSECPEITFAGSGQLSCDVRLEEIAAPDQFDRSGDRLLVASPIRLACPGVHLERMAG